MNLKVRFWHRGLHLDMGARYHKSTVSNIPNLSVSLFTGHTSKYKNMLTSVLTECARAPRVSVVLTIRSLSPLSSKCSSIGFLKIRGKAYDWAGEWYTMFSDCETLGWLSPVVAIPRAIRQRDEQLFPL
jgi:hypothetical protein